MKQPYKVVIFCGGLGMRLRTYPDNVPKALVKIGDKPILWHVMKLYSHYGFRDFILTLGYKGNLIVEYFERYRKRYCDFTISFSNQDEHFFHTCLAMDESEWTITFVQTGKETQTGGRLKRAKEYINEDHFLATYVDGLTDVNIEDLLQKHIHSNMDVTMLSVNLPTSYGLLESQNGVATRFREKPLASDRINGGFFVFKRTIFDLIHGDDVILEREPLQRLVEEGRVGVYNHDGFWRCMDTMKDAVALSKIWESGNPPWKIWE